MRDTSSAVGSEELGDVAGVAWSSSGGGVARVKRAERLQREWREFALEETLPADHRARLVWQFVSELDLSPWYESIRAVEGRPGRDAVDPRILMSLMLFATLEGVSSDRHIARLCERDLAYRWICGGVGVNHHLLSDFRTAHGERLETLLTNIVAALLHQGLVTLETVAQDGMRVRASAGSSSFRRQATLEERRQEAADHLQRLRAERAENSGDGDARRQAARERAAREREARLAQALVELQQLAAQKEQREAGAGEQARASTTDPEARVMKMGDGGYRPAYNVQFTSDGDAQVIVSVDLVNSGSDRGQLAPMYEKMRQYYPQIPRKYLIDCGFATKKDITAVEQRGTQVYAPIHGESNMLARGIDPYARRRDDTDETFAARQRMATDEARQLYRRRAAIAEFPNAECRNRGLRQFRVRGLLKAKAAALWYALAHNLLRIQQLKKAA